MSPRPNLLSWQSFHFLFLAAHIQRWNEFIRPPIGMSELDKQAHKAFIMFILAKTQEEHQSCGIDYELLIKGFLFEFFERTLLTDIKPPIFKEIQKSHATELHRWALEALQKEAPAIHAHFAKDMEHYFLPKDAPSLEQKILRAAHYLSSRWEFEILYPMNQGIYGIEETKQATEQELEDHFSLESVKQFALKQKSHNFTNLLGRLRFQQRWISTPRTPDTTVMGHALIVGILSYFGMEMLEGDPCGARKRNAFFAGLFHDLPEVLTRDIISPIKRSVQGLEQIIGEIEHKLIEGGLIPIAPRAIQESIRYFVYDEFSPKIRDQGAIEKLLDSQTLHHQYNEDQYDGIDGPLINACDKLAAFIEAKLSIAHGISSSHLTHAIEKMQQTHRSSEILGIDFGSLYV